MPIHTLVVGELQSNCYIVHADGEREALIVDAGGDADMIAAEIRSRELVPSALFLTHGHIDHMAGADELRDLFPEMNVACHADERELLTRPSMNLSYFIGGTVEPREPDRFVSDGDVLEAGPLKLSVIHVPGHTPGGAALYGMLDGEGVLIAGDLLFAGGVGRTDFPGGNWEDLISGIRSRLYALPDDTRVYPGHGPATTIGQEKRSNPFVSVQED